MLVIINFICKDFAVPRLITRFEPRYGSMNFALVAFATASSAKAVNEVYQEEPQNRAQL